MSFFVPRCASCHNRMKIQNVLDLQFEGDKEDLTIKFCSDCWNAIFEHVRNRYNWDRGRYNAPKPPHGGGPGDV